jgi:hypothetical protein
VIGDTAHEVVNVDRIPEWRTQAEVIERVHQG